MCLQQGNICCYPHLRAHSTAMVDADPAAPQWLTPLNTWTRVTAAARAEWLHDPETHTQDDPTAQTWVMVVNSDASTAPRAARCAPPPIHCRPLTM